MTESVPVRNIGVLAHVDAGKTSITERILSLTGVKNDAGSVDDGTTATDYLSVERRHGITVKSAAVQFAWKGSPFNLIDTPGHVDFSNEVHRVLQILDGAIIALCAVSGVQARTEVISDSCKERSLPRLYFINKMDRTGADFGEVFQDLRSSIEPAAVAIQMPVFSGRNWTGIVDLIAMRRIDCITGISSDLTGANPPEKEILAQAIAARQKLVEAVAEHDETVLSLFAQDKEIPSDLLAKSLSELAWQSALVPVACGSAFNTASIELLLDAAVRYLPDYQHARVPDCYSPGSGQLVRLEPNPEESLAAFVFKTTADAEQKTYSWVRVWAGSLQPGASVLNSQTGKIIHIKKLYSIQASEVLEVSGAKAGDIIAIEAELASPGATLCAKHRPLAFEELKIPPPVVVQILEPLDVHETPGIRKALRHLAREDASLIVRDEADTGRFEIAGQGELHLQIVVERLYRDFGFKVRTGNPRVTCKEKPKKAVRITEEFDRDFGGARIRTSISLNLEPFTDANDNIVQFAPDLRLQQQHREAVLRGIESALSVGPAEGWPLVNTKITITQLIPPDQSSGRNGETAVEAASALACRKALLISDSIVLEPVMETAIECPEDFFGQVLALINSRQGQIDSVEDGISRKHITARITMRMLFGFSSDLSSASQGYAQFQASFAGYEPRR